MYVVAAVRSLPKMERSPSEQTLRATLAGAGPLAVVSARGLAYDTASRVLARVDWTGAERDTGSERPSPPVVPPVLAVKDLVRVVSINFDAAEPGLSIIQIRFLPASVRAGETAVRYEGDPLSPSHPEIRVASITPGAVTFTFTDTTRAPERLSCATFDARSAIVVLGENEAWIECSRLAGRPPQSVAGSGLTVALGPNRYVLGPADIRRLADDFAVILGNEVETTQYRDPKSGRYDGIQIRCIQAGSIVERLGIRQGDVVRSINGHPVRTTSEAITYVKANQDKHSTWDVVVENTGKMRTVTYDLGARP
jgi:hypothetical protein